MRVVTADQVRALTPWDVLIESVRATLCGPAEAPPRQQYAIPVPCSPSARMAVMPAWSPGEYVGVKVAWLFPGNTGRGAPTGSAGYLLASGTTGELLAVIEGGELTARRTAAVSALAARYLARPESRHLLVVGTGRIARHLAAAHARVRPIERVSVWSRDAGRAAGLAGWLAGQGLDARPAGDLACATAEADIVTCATLAATPVLRGEWVRPGTHVDLVGSSRAETREADDALIRRARVFVDSRAGALAEAGELAQPIAAGTLGADAVAGELADLCRGLRPGRERPDEITVFKAVGTALADPAAAGLVYRGLLGAGE